MVIDGHSIQGACHHQSCQCDLESCRNLGLIPDLIPAIPVYQIRIVMTFYGCALKFTGIKLMSLIPDSRTKKI